MIEPVFETSHKRTSKPNDWNGKYNIIYADPPWKYNNEIPSGSAAHYDVMSIDDLKLMPVLDIADDNSMLFMWACFPMLQEALDLIKAWGFTYKTVAFNWIKLTKNGGLFWGQGSYTRSNPEVCLLGIKGKSKVISHGVLSVVLEPVEKHSKKPDNIREKIVQLCGDLPRIELFARESTDGWDVFENEVESNIKL